MVRVARLRAGGRGVGDWSRKPLAFPVSRGPVRRRNLPPRLPDPGGDARLHADADRDRHRAQDPAEPADGLLEAPPRVGLPRSPRDDHPDPDRPVLLRHRRLGDQVFHHLRADGLYGSRTDGTRGCGLRAVLHGLHLRAVRAVRLRHPLHPRLRGGHRPRRQERHREVEPRPHAAPARPRGLHLGLRRVPAGVRVGHRLLPAAELRLPAQRRRAVLVRHARQDDSRRDGPDVLFALAGDGHYGDVRLVYEEVGFDRAVRPPHRDLRYAHRNHRGPHDHPGRLPLRREDGDARQGGNEPGD